jgi:hypothetical protein
VKNLKGYLYAGLASASVLTVGGVAMAEAQDGTPTFGGIPDSAFTDEGIDASDLPDYVAVSIGAGDDAVGYVRSSEYFADDQGPRNPDEAAAMGFVYVGVYDVFDTNQTVIGHWVTGAGFVPLGEDVDTVVQSVKDHAHDEATMLPPDAGNTGVSSTDAFGD